MHVCERKSASATPYQCRSYAVLMLMLVYASAHEENETPVTIESAVVHPDIPRNDRLISIS
jgi:hypothetical protein